MLSREQEMELLEQDIRHMRARLRSLERAPSEGRWTRGDTEWMDACANMQLRVDILGMKLGHLRLADELEQELA